MSLTANAFKREIGIRTAFDRTDKLSVSIRTTASGCLQHQARFSTCTSPPEGRQLGLWCKAIVEQHCGVLSVSSEAGGGPLSR
jgi:hypothetical protein